MAMKITIPKGRAPDRVTVNIHSEDYNSNKDSDFNNPDGVTFTDIPEGLTFVNVDAFLNNKKVMMGSGQIDIQKGPNSIQIDLNKIFTVYSITDMEESQFNKDDMNISSFWAAHIGQDEVILSNQQTTTRAEVYSVRGETSLFFLAEITDFNFMPGQGEPEGEEWENDVFVLYICLDSPENDAFLNSPQFRIQCKIGETNPSDGELEVISKQVSPQINKKAQISAWAEIDVKIIDRPVNNKRILEMRIPRNFISMTTIGNNAFHGGIVIRYNDQNNQTFTKLDWKKSSMDPEVNKEAWGIMEFE